MEENKYYIKISPEVILSDITQVPYTGTPIYYQVLTGNTNACCIITGYTTNTDYPTGTTGYYIPMQNLLSGGTNGSSLLTGLTIPILITESAVDMGYYSVFDGMVQQIDVVKNFVFSATTGTPYTYHFYNTSEQLLKTYLQFSNYEVDWGDGLTQSITTYSPNFISHTYINNPTPTEYTITLKQTNPWGTNTIKKTVVVPFTGTTITNPNGTATFTSFNGSWSATPISYDFLFTGDSVNTIAAQVTSNYPNFTSTPFNISGYTTSRLTELQQYGVNKYQPYTWIKKHGVNYGQITTDIINFNDYTGYTIDNVNYVDFPDGTTIYVLESSGLTSNWMVEEPITKDESLLNIVYAPQVQSNVFIERGKNSVLERIERLGEVDNIGDLINYGYGFFNVVNQ
jgi:hypothetical protein